MKYINVEDNKTLALQDMALPKIADDECLVKVKAIGVNRADLLQRDGKYPAPAGESDILGLEVCGEIIEFGQLLTPHNFALNEQVFALVAGGGYAEYVAVKLDQLFKLPLGLSPIEGAAIAEVFLTAYQSLFWIAKLHDVKKRVDKPHILIHAGASGVGTAAIQLAKLVGCFVVVTTSNETKARACLALGADAVINYHTTDFVQWTKSQKMLGFDIIIDVVAGDYLSRNIQVCALDGHIVQLAMLGGRFSESVDVAKMLAKRITISASTLRNRDAIYKAQLVRDFTSDFYSPLSQGKIKPVIDSCFSWTKADLAHQKMARNANMGKIVLAIE